MSTASQKRVFAIIAVFGIALTGGCSRLGGSASGSSELVPEVDLGLTVGSLATVYVPQPIAVEGYGLVGALKGTGSSQCPAEIRAYLTRYILTSLPEQNINVKSLLASPDTAVVYVTGSIPSMASKGELFDLKVTALNGTQTTSLEGGWLYGAELKMAGNFGLSTRTLAIAGGPIYIDALSSSAIDQRTGYILNGGKVHGDYEPVVILKKMDYEQTNRIRNRLNSRFGPATVKALIPGSIELSVPEKYRQEKVRFVELVNALYLEENPELTDQRIRAFIRRLVVEPDKDSSEVALEAIGYPSRSKLEALLNLSREDVRFHAARCLLWLGSDMGLRPLADMALRPNSAHRLTAMKTLTGLAPHDEASAIARRLLLYPDFDVRLPAYEQLQMLDDAAVVRDRISDSFYLDQVAPASRPGIYVSRSGEPKIVLFGAPIYCQDNLFVQSRNGRVMINAPRGQPYVTLIVKDAKHPGGLIQLNSSFKLSDIIRVLCQDVARPGQATPGGLGVSYAQMVAMIRMMCERGAIPADFRAGPLPNIG